MLLFLLLLDSLAWQSFNQKGKVRGEERGNFGEIHVYKTLLWKYWWTQHCCCFEHLLYCDLFPGWRKVHTKRSDNEILPCCTRTFCSLCPPLILSTQKRKFKNVQGSDSPAPLALTALWKENHGVCTTGKQGGSSWAGGGGRCEWSWSMVWQKLCLVRC